MKSVTTKKKGLKKSVVFLLSSIFAMSLAGCGSTEITGVTDTSDVQYQYMSVSVEDIMVQQGKKDIPLSEINKPFTFASPNYSGNVLSVYVDGVLYETTLSNYVLADGVEWSYDGSSSLPYEVEDGILRNPAYMTADITYADGTVLPVTAEYVEITKAGDVAEVYCLVGSTTFYSTMPIADPKNPIEDNRVFPEGSETGPEDETTLEEEGAEGNEGDEQDSEGESDAPSEDGDESQEPSGDIVYPTEEGTVGDDDESSTASSSSEQ